MYRIRVQSYQNILKKVDSGTITRILSHDDSRKAERFHFEADRNRFIAARVLFWLELTHIGDSYPNVELPVNFSYNTYGKPSLDGFSWHFNWSHSGDLIGLTLGSDPVGIDVEQVPNKPLFDYKSLCTPDELAWIMVQVASYDRTEKEAFILIWSAKEAVLKAIGTGLSIDPRNVAIEFDPNKHHSWKCKINRFTLYGTSEYLNADGNGYAISWCSTSPERAPTILGDISQTK